MGWSCTLQAHNVLEAACKACRASTGMPNAWRSKNTEYFFEVGREQADGHIAARVYRMIDERRARPAGSIYITPHGEIRRMPASLRRLIGGNDGENV